MNQRVALYARFSSDLQRQTSIDDQLRAARGRAAAEGWQVVVERSDSAVSGATPFALRPGSKALMADALAGRFDVLIVEGLDRTFRMNADEIASVLPTLPDGSHEFIFHPRHENDADQRALLELKRRTI